MFAAKVAQDNIINSDLNNDNNDNDQNEKIVIESDTNNEQNEQVVIEDNNLTIDSTPKAVETKKQTINTWEQTKGIFWKLIHGLPKKTPHITTEDFHQMNEHQQR